MKQRQPKCRKGHFGFLCQSSCTNTFQSVLLLTVLDVDCKPPRGARKVEHMLWVFDNKVSELVRVTQRRIKISNWPLGEYLRQPRLKMKGLIKLESLQFGCYFSCRATGTWTRWRWQSLFAFEGDAFKRHVKPKRMHIRESSGRWVINHVSKGEMAADCSVLDKWL